MATSERDERVLVLMPTVKDGARCRDILAQVGLASAVCKDSPGLKSVREIAEGAGRGIAHRGGGCG